MKRRLTSGVAAIAITAAMAAPAMAETLDIGVSMSRAAHQFLVKVSDAMKAEATAIGDIDLQIEDAEGDVSKQLSQVQNFVAQASEIETVLAEARKTNTGFVAAHQFMDQLPAEMRAVLDSFDMVEQTIGRPLDVLSPDIDMVPAA